MAQVPMAAAAHLVPPPPASDPNAPGRFAFADPKRVKGILERSGWGKIAIERLDVDTPVTLEDAMIIGLRLGPLGQALQQGDEALRRQVLNAVEAAFRSHLVDGMVPMTAGLWLVSAEA